MGKEKEVLGDVKKFTVKRKRWQRGSGATGSRLLNYSNKMCCLGFYAKACGLSNETIVNQATPSDAAVRYSYEYEHVNDFKPKIISEWKTRLINRSGNDTKLCIEMMTVNDNQNLSDSEREKKLKALFKKIDVSVKFED